MSKETDTLESELREARERIRVLEEERERITRALDAAGVGTWRWDKHKDLVEWDEAMLKVFGTEKAPTSYSEYVKHIHPEDLSRVTETIGQSFTTGTYEDLVHRVRADDDTVRSVQARGEILRDEAGEVVGLHGLVWDVTEQKKMERELAESQARLELALDASRLGTWRSDLQTGQLEWDEGMLRVFGVDRAPKTGEELLKLVHPDDHGRLRRANATLIKSGVCVEPEVRVVTGSPNQRWVIMRGRVERDASGRAVALFGGAIDVTRLKELEEQLHRAQRLEAVGHLAAGVAHNFNNLLMGIMPNVEIALGAIPGGIARESLEDAAVATQRAASLIRQLMHYSRPEDGVVGSAADAREVVKHTVQLVTESMDRKLHVETSFAPDLPSLRIDPHQLSQMLMNLLINASEALQGHPAPKLAVSLEVVDGDDEAAAPTMVRLKVSDNGPGIPDEDRDRIFQPFFTTKAPTATGLGLAMVDAAVRRVGGAIHLESTEGAGTTLAIDLPVGHAAPASKPDDEPITEHPRSMRRLLVVDDEKVVRRTLARVLKRAGHEVIEAASGRAALEILDREADRIDGVLVDHWMPDLNGYDLVMEARSKGITTPYLILSGNPAHPELAELEGPRLRKPVLSSELLDAVDALGA